MEKFKEGTRVRATSTITGSDPKKDNRDEYEDVVFAVPGDKGTVVHTEREGFPTVKFDSTGKATIVFTGEVEPLHDQKE